jgi:hypothetical protein
MNVIFFLLLTSLKKFWKLGFAKILKGKSMFHCLGYVLSLSCSPGRQSTTWAIPQSKRYFKNKCVNSFFHITQLSTCLKISTSGICLCLNCNVIYWVFPVPPKYAHQKQMVPPNKIKFQVLFFFISHIYVLEILILPLFISIYSLYRGGICCGNSELPYIVH